MNRPLFSIITITYNAAQTLPPTLESVDGQTCTDYEHLVIDGASPDGTAALSTASGNTRRHTYSSPDKGLYDAMNKGLALAKGKYLIFLNAGDTFSTPDTLEAYAEVARTGADIVYADTRLVDASRHVLGARHLSVPERLTFKSFARGMLVCHQAFCVRRDLAGRYDLSYRFSADYAWCLDCLRRSDPERCVNLRRVAIDYLSDGMTDKNRRASLRERYKIMCRAYGTLPTMLRHAGFALRALRRKIATNHGRKQS